MTSKELGVGILTMLMLSGILIAGSEAQTWPLQFAGCVVGWLVFAGSAWAIAKILRG